jgi:threonine dehydrogenase-like Zn-dependent dehydrogenase
MRAAKKTDAERAVVIETALPQLGRGDVLVRVHACAICATDLPGWASPDLGDESPGTWNANNPGLTGHEVAGEIVEVGDGSLSARIGERVWVDPIAGCGRCAECRAGRQTLCPDVSVICVGFAEYLAAPARQCRPIPDGLDYPTASLLCDTVGAAFGAVKRAGVREGESVAVWGLGPVGLGLVQAARIEGAAAIVGCDPVPSRRRFAETVGATVTVDPIAAGAFARPDVVLCSAPGPEAAQQAYDALRLGGRMVTLAGFPPVRGHRPKWVSGSWGCDEMYWPEAIDHVIAGRFRLDGYVTHTLPLDAIEEAFRIRLHDAAGSLKVVVLPS